MRRNNEQILFGLMLLIVFTLSACQLPGEVKKSATEEHKLPILPVIVPCSEKVDASYLLHHYENCTEGFGYPARGLCATRNDSVYKAFETCNNIPEHTEYTGWIADIKKTGIVKCQKLLSGDHITTVDLSAVRNMPCEIVGKVSDSITNMKLERIELGGKSHCVKYTFSRESNQSNYPRFFIDHCGKYDMMAEQCEESMGHNSLYITCKDSKGNEISIWDESGSGVESGFRILRAYLIHLGNSETSVDLLINKTSRQPVDRCCPQWGQCTCVPK